MAHIEGTLEQVRDLGFRDGLLGIDPDAPITALGEGFSSQVFAVDGYVLKVATGKTEEDARRLRGVMLDEHTLNTYYLRNHIPQTEFIVRSSEVTGQHHVIAHQPRVDGRPIEEHVASSGDMADVTRMLQAGAVMHWLSGGKIADLACIERGFFDPFKTPNVIVTDNNRAILVDSTFGRIQRSPALGAVWSKFIRGGVERGLRKLTPRH